MQEVNKINIARQCNRCCRRDAKLFSVGFVCRFILPDCKKSGGFPFCFFTPSALANFFRRRLSQTKKYTARRRRVFLGNIGRGVCRFMPLYAAVAFSLQMQKACRRKLIEKCRKTCRYAKHSQYNGKRNERGFVVVNKSTHFLFLLIVLR